MDEKLYQDELMDHFKYPRNKKTLKNPCFVAGQDNPSCGDRVSIEGIVKDGIIMDLGFSGTGCVISQAATSMLTEYVKGKSCAAVLALTKDDMVKLVGIQLGPNRLKCAILCLQVLQQAITDYNKKKGL